MRAVWAWSVCVVIAGCGQSGAASDAGMSSDAGIDAAAAIGADAAGLSAFEDEILRAHNMVRASASPAPLPALTPLGWSASAATTAQQWANGCRFMHNSGSGFGENIYASSNTTSGSDVVGSWASEVSSYDYAANRCSGTCGHYTQIVWRTSLEVGCAAATCTTNSPFGGGSWFFVVCDYSPPGNFSGQRPY